MDATFALNTQFVENKAKLVQYIKEELGGVFIADGRHREVYDLPDQDTVVKIPFSSFTKHVNAGEYHAYLRSVQEGDERYAKCELKVLFGIEVLFMEKVECLFGPNEPAPYRVEEYLQHPRWIYLIDSEQVGINKEGKLVAYDYSDDELDIQDPEKIDWQNLADRDIYNGNGIRKE